MTKKTGVCLFCGKEFFYSPVNKWTRLNYCPGSDCRLKNMRDVKKRSLTVKQTEAEKNRGVTCWRGEVRCKHYAANWLDETKLSCECVGYEPEPRRNAPVISAIPFPRTGFRCG